MYICYIKCVSVDLLLYRYLHKHYIAACFFSFYHLQTHSFILYYEYIYLLSLFIHTYKEKC